MLSMSVFLVLVLPLCWYGALTQAAILGAQAPSAADSNEEPEDHDGHEEGDALASTTRAPRAPHVGPASPTHRRDAGIRVVHAAARLCVGLPAPHPSLLSVRRLI